MRRVLRCGVLAAILGCAISANAQETFVPKFAPFVSIVGGVKADSPIQAATETKEPRMSTIMLADFGVRGTIGDFVSFESELMANGGTSLHGTSAFEGQAAMQVRGQLVRVTFDPFLLEVGRVVDEASVDFLSAHVGDALFQDAATRDPLLYTGYNLGNGVRATVEVLPKLRFGVAFNAGNPVSTTGSLMIGGSFPPFDRFYYQPWQAVGKGANHYPDDTFHIMMLTPSFLYDGDVVQARAAFQAFVVDTDTTKTSDDNIRGFNARANVRVKTFDDLLVAFVNGSFTQNDTVDPTNVNHRVADKYRGIGTGGGLDVNVAHRFRARADGIGAQYEKIQYQVGSGPVTRIDYLNVGATLWAFEALAIGARYAYWRQHNPGGDDTGERAVFLTLRLIAG